MKIAHACYIVNVQKVLVVAIPNIVCIFEYCHMLTKASLMLDKAYNMILSSLLMVLQINSICISAVTGMSHSQTLAITGSISLILAAKKHGLIV